MDFSDEFTGNWQDNWFRDGQIAEGDNSLKKAESTIDIAFKLSSKHKYWIFGLMTILACT